MLPYTEVICAALPLLPSIDLVTITQMLFRSFISILFLGVASANTVMFYSLARTVKTLGKLLAWSPTTFTHNVEWFVTYWLQRHVTSFILHSQPNDWHDGRQSWR